MPRDCGTTKGNENEQRVGLIYDERMCKHNTSNQQDHPECPNRIRVIWELLNSSGLAQRCVILDAKVASDNHLALVHTKSHLDLIKNVSSKKPNSKRNRIARKFDSIYFNEGSSEAALLAAGSVVEVTEKVAKGELDSAFAIVRPPGHHAEEGEPMGFCLYNNVAVAASFLLNERPELGIKKILIVDWDVHHGNGTQNMFYDDPRVLVFSVHRHEGGKFYPGGDDGSYIMTGEGPGAGYNINVPWENDKCGDADYLAVWYHILLPVANQFGPDIVIISAGFDAAKGDPLGGCCVSPYGYSVMLHELMKFAKGKIVMALEGGYNPKSLAESAKACVEVLLNREPVTGYLDACPLESTWCVIQAVRRELSAYWPTLDVELPDSVSSNTTTLTDPLKNLEVNWDCQEQAGEKIKLESSSDQSTSRTSGTRYSKRQAAPDDSQPKKKAKSESPHLDPNNVPPPPRVINLEKIFPTPPVKVTDEDLFNDFLQLPGSYLEKGKTFLRWLVQRSDTKKFEGVSASDRSDMAISMFAKMGCCVGLAFKDLQSINTLSTTQAHEIEKLSQSLIEQKTENLKTTELLTQSQEQVRKLEGQIKEMKEKHDRQVQQVMEIFGS